MYECTFSKDTQDVHKKYENNDTHFYQTSKLLFPNFRDLRQSRIRCRILSSMPWGLPFICPTSLELESFRLGLVAPRVSSKKKA